MWSHLTFIFLSLHLGVPQKLRLAPIYWNTSNPLFKSSTSTNPIEVEMYYEIDLVCPTYPPDYPPHLQETYIIYQVPKADHNDCELRNDISMLVNCSAPHERRRFTLIFQAFQPIANTPEYREGETYYAITTSTGKKDKLNNRHQGACASNHMKVAFYIRPSGLTKVKPKQPSHVITTRRPRKKTSSTPQAYTTRLFITSSPISGNNRQFQPHYPYYTVDNNKNSHHYNTIYSHNHDKYNNKITSSKKNKKITDNNSYNKKITKKKNSNHLFNKSRSAPGFSTSSHSLTKPQRQQPNKIKTKNFKTYPNKNNNNFSNKNNNINNNKNNNINNNKNNAAFMSKCAFSFIFYTHTVILMTELFFL